MPEQIFQPIPETITVHLGRPDAAAENVTVPFADYIKNVASSEIYPNWPESALRANIYAITTYALNRIYSEYYRSRGYDFDITNSTAFDQAFVPDRDIFENISVIVDELFNDYVVRQGTVNPLFTQFCNGTTSTCDGLSQWGTVSLAEEGLTPYEILQRYYGDDINIINNAPVQNIEESYPGAELRIGDAGNDVEIIQDELNRIAQNYPAIPKITDPDGIFGVTTEAAVRSFQEIFNLPITGVIDKATWYRIKRYYTGVKSLAELVSEGVSLEEAQVPFETTLSIGSVGPATALVQYYLNIIAYFGGNFNLFPITAVYDEQTADAVRAFQQFYSLPETAQVDRTTWNKLKDVYLETISSIPESFYGNRAKLYPGYVLSFGQRSADVETLQTYLSFIADYYSALPKIPVTGYFGEQTREAVEEFQRLFGLEVTGFVGALTWAEIGEQYNFLVDTELN